MDQTGTVLQWVDYWAEKIKVTIFFLNRIKQLVTAKNVAFVDGIIDYDVKKKKRYDPVYVCFY